MKHVDPAAPEATDSVSRRADITKALRQRGFLSVSFLARQHDVDTSTIRRDLQKLEARGLVERTHGGAVAVDIEEELALESLEPLARQIAAIGAATAEYVLDGQTVLLDSGATVVEVARRLNNERLTVITHDMRVGLEIAKKPNINLIFIGGELLPGRYSMWGPASIQQLDTMRANVVIFGTDAVRTDGLYASSSYEIELKRKMRAIATEAIFVADSTKFGRDALFAVFGFEDFTRGITDWMLDPARAEQFPISLVRASLPGQPVGDSRNRARPEFL